MTHSGPLFNSIAAFVLLSACGGVQLTERQKKECVPDESSEKTESGFLTESVALPESIRCLRKPSTKARKVSSRFRDKDHPFRPGGHTGTDYPMPAGTEIVAVAAGTVIYAETTASDVNIVIVDMGEGWKFQVLHLSEILVAKGDTVVAGEPIGLSGGAVGAPGSGPCTTGPHLHISVSYEGKYLDMEDLYCAESS